MLPLSLVHVMLVEDRARIEDGNRNASGRFGDNNGRYSQTHAKYAQPSADLSASSVKR